MSVLLARSQQDPCCDADSTEVHSSSTYSPSSLHHDNFHARLQALAIDYEGLVTENLQLRRALQPPVGCSAKGATAPALTTKRGDSDQEEVEDVASRGVNCFGQLYGVEADRCLCSAAGVRVYSDDILAVLDSDAVLKAAKQSLRSERSWIGAKLSPDSEEHGRTPPVLRSEAWHATANESGSGSAPLTRHAARIKSSTDVPAAEGEMQPTRSITSFADEAQRANGAGPIKSMFGDSDAMKEMVRKEMLKGDNTYDVASKYKTEGFCQAIARSSVFENVTLGMIALYAIWMAVDTDHNGADMITEAHPIFFAAEQIFCTYFFLELLIRYLAFRRTIDCFTDPWFVFDSFLVLAMVLEVWVMTAIVLATSSSNTQTSVLGSASILRVARLMRLSRLFRMARLIRMVPELLIMIKAIMAATRSVFFTLMLLLIVLYIFGIAMVQTLRDSDIGDEKFHSVVVAMHSLFLHGTLLDDISSVLEALEEEGSVMGIVLMYVFIILAAITIMNMLIGVLCEVITAVAAAEKEAIKVNWVKSILEDILKLSRVDKNSDGQLQKDEFFKMLQHREAREALRAVDVDVVTLVDFADIIFEEKEASDESAFSGLRGAGRRSSLPVKEDDDGKSSREPGGGEAQEISISFADLMEMVLQLRMTNLATVRDIVDLRKFLSLRFKVMEEMLRQMTKRFAGGSGTDDMGATASTQSHTTSIRTNDAALAAKSRKALGQPSQSPSPPSARFLPEMGQLPGQVTASEHAIYSNLRQAALTAEDKGIEETKL